MANLVQFVARIAIFIYALVAVGVFFALRSYFQARRARRLSIYALEREASQTSQRRAFNTMLLLILSAAAVYVITNIVEPNLAESPIVTPEPTPVVFVEEESTATPFLLLYPTITPTIPLAPAEAADSPETAEEVVDGCSIIGATITSPAPGDIVGGQVAVEGEMNVLNFAQYKFEVNGAGTGGVWVVVGTYNSPVPRGYLGTWDTTSLAPGAYTLRLVTIRADGTYLTPCEVPVTVGASAPAEGGE